MAEEVVGHNVDFDLGVVGAELVRCWGKNYLFGMGAVVDTMKAPGVAELVGIAKANGFGFKWPKLMELYVKLFGSEFEGAHDSLEDVTATRECFWELKRRGII